MQKSEAFSILDPILLGGYTRYITDIRSKSPGLPCKPQTNTSYVFLGQHACRLDLSHTNVHIFKICQDAPKKTVRVSDFWNAIKMVSFFGANVRTRNVQPQTGSFNRNWRTQLFGQYCFAWFLISSKTHMKKYVLFLQCNEFVNFVRVYVGQANVISKWPTG